MRTTILTWIARPALVAIALTAALAGCEDPWDPPTYHLPDPSDRGDGGGSPRRNTCLMDMLYLVEGDTFTRMSSGLQTFGAGTSVQGPYGWRPDIEPRAKSKLDLNGYNGTAYLLWNDVAVGTFPIDRDFLRSDHVGILSHDDPDGTRVELHVYAQPSCGAFPADVSTRAQIEALER